MSNITISAGETLSDYIFSAGVDAAVASGGTVVSSVLLSASFLSVAAGGVASDVTVSSGGLISDDGGRLAGTLISGGRVSIAKGSTKNTEVGYGGTFVAYDGVIDQTTVSGGGIFFYSDQSGVGGGSGATVRSGGEIVVSAGVMSGLALRSGAIAVVSSGGGLAGTVSAGGTVVVMPVHADLSGLVAQSGATVALLGGGTQSGLTVAAGATLQTDTVAIFRQLGVASTVVALGTQLSGDVLKAGETETVFAGGSATHTNVLAGGVQILSGGLASQMTLSGGLQLLSGGSASDITIRAGGLQIVTGNGFADAVASAVTVSSGGYSEIYGSGADIVVDNGGVVLLAAQSAAGLTVRAGGLAEVMSGTVTDVAVEAGATVLVDNQSYLAGASVEGTVDSGATFEVLPSGKADVGSGLTLEHGATLVLLGGATLKGVSGEHDATVVSAAVAVISTTYVPTGLAGIEGTFTQVTSYGDVLNGVTLGSFDANETVYGGGMATSTTLRGGGTQIVDSGGVAEATTISAGGTQSVSGTASGTTIAGGFQDVVSGTVIGTTIGAGGSQYFLSKDAASVTADTVTSGGLLYDDGSHATIDGLALGSGGSVAASFDNLTDIAFQAGGSLTLRYLAYQPGGTAMVNGADVLTVTEGSKTATLQLTGNYSDETFYVSDATGRTLVTLSAATEASRLAAASGDLVPGGSYAALSAAAPAAELRLGGGFAAQQAMASETFPIAPVHPA